MPEGADEPAVSKLMRHNINMLTDVEWGYPYARGAVAHLLFVSPPPMKLGVWTVVGVVENVRQLNNREIQSMRIPPNFTQRSLEPPGTLQEAQKASEGGGDVGGGKEGHSREGDVVY